MILALLIFFPLAFGQADLSILDEMDEEDLMPALSASRKNFLPPTVPIPLDEIRKSGTSNGALKEGSYLWDIKTGKSRKISQMIYVKYFNQENEHSFKYLQDNDGGVTWKTRSSNVEPIKEDISLYVPPLRYTPAPKNIIRSEYDKKLTLRPEFTYYAGLTAGDYIQDLLNESDSVNGTGLQYGIHFFTDWNLPLKAGAVFHFEQSTYDLSKGGRVTYTSPSIGPQFKSANFMLLEQPLRFQSQFRISPFARALIQTPDENVNFKFNSADLLVSLERPIDNRLGEFVLGFFFQAQWLNLRNQDRDVEVRASNKTNKTLGITLGQVF